MLVEVESFENRSRSLLLARIKTPVGRAVAVWVGDRDAASGGYYVEWTVDAVIGWGRNARSSTVCEPGVGAEGHCVVLRGKLRHLEHGAAALDLAGGQILLDVEGSMPEDTDGTWVELVIEQERVAIYPYSL
ncbi:hypothetical protein [Catellatospora paridis]|uniref:hypothetical protein n=1 Tax=Catellatospora paridis TaxID=1617086 RepID=UPI0012D37556|nr:hypothetical protein [Catellatospora paridis]